MSDSADTEIRRQALESNIAFQDLGEPIQKLLLLLNAEVSEEDLSLLSKITVRQLAKVFDMLGSGEDPEKIMAWLRRTARRNIDGDDPYANERKKKVFTGASRDPIAFYKEIERRNIELQERHRKAGEEREKQRKANLAKREEQRKAQAARIAEEKKRAEENGENTTALDRLARKDRTDLTNTFEKFVTKLSTYDNSMKAQDNEWWKKDEYRREFEKLGKKGLKWKSVDEHASTPATDAELAAREEWFKSQGWWKGDKYRNDWLKTRDVEWWKETPYIRDWQEKGAKGTMWTAADESSGFNRKGQSHTAPMEELERRIQWYKVNGPKGVVKLWNALGEGMTDRCTLEEKREREDYFKNGDWWRSEDEFRKYNKLGSGCGALTFAGAAGCDREWWKDEKYRQDFLKGGDSWKCANETAVAQGKAKDAASTESEMKKREEWFRENWWKSQAFIDDYKVNGEKGTLWRCRSEEDSKSGNPKPVKESEAAQRALWYQSAEDREWWKDEVFLQDYEQNGPNGKKWLAASSEFGVAGRAKELPISDAEKKKREEWFKQNWWKADRFKKDFLENPDSTAWKVADMTVNQDKDWWKQPEFREDFQKHADEVLPPEDFWKSGDAIQDFIENGENGKVWKAADALYASVNKGDQKPAAAEEMAKRKEWISENWWRATKFQEDWAANGIRGALWTSADLSSAGTHKAVASPEELHKRQEAYKPAGTAWKGLTETDGVNREASKCPCSSVEALDRARWYKQNWWKSAEAREDFEKNGTNGTVWKAASMEAGKAAKGAEADFQADAEELKQRERWFQMSGDLEFWKDPAYIDDFAAKGTEGALWQARNAVDARRAMGKDHPVTEKELKDREAWYKANQWKSASALRDFAEKGASSDAWKKNADGTPCSDEEITRRSAWLKAHAPASEEVLEQRQTFLRNQLTDTEIKHRQGWLDNKGKEDKRINTDELSELLTAINQGMPVSDEQIKAVQEKIAEHRSKNLIADAEADSISQEEFVHAVAEAGFYVAPTDQEQKMNEQEALEEYEKEEAARLEEEAAFLAMEAEEERKNAGITEDAPAEEEMTAEEKAFLEQQEAAREPPVNEDDVVTAEQESAWEEFAAVAGTEAVVTMDEEEIARREAARVAEEERRKAEEAAWAQEAQVDDSHEEEHVPEDEEEVPAVAQMNDEDKEQLAAEVLDDEDAEWREDEEEVAPAAAAAAEPADEMTVEEKGAPQPWKLPLPQVKNPQYLKAYFTVLKFTPKPSLLGGKQKRIWVVDHFSRSFYNMDMSGKIRREHAANKLLQLEKNVTDSRRLRLMFFDAAHSYELLFPNCEERERFFETASAIRPSIRVYAPALTKPDSTSEVCSTTIDAIGKNTVTVRVPNIKGEIVDRELTGECKINSSNMLTEPLTVWCGTFNLSGATPPKNPAEMGKWIPKDKYEIYAIAVQEASYQREENEWFQYIQSFLGKEYLTLANMNLWDTYLIVLTKKKNLLKITNVEGSTKATQHKNVCGTKGGVGISLRFHDTSMCFVTCQLAARQERTAMRNTNLQEIIDCLQLSNKDTDFTQQFNHVFFFGDFNYRLDMDDAKAMPLIQQGNFPALLESCQFNTQRKADGLLHGFKEAEINFRPTYRFKKGTTEYNSEKGAAPSYTDRVLVKSMENTWIRCLTYTSCETLNFSEHAPVSASYIVRAVRPAMALFHAVQQPKIRFVFPEITVIENKGLAMKKPGLILTTFISDSPHEVKVSKPETATPSWVGGEVPEVDVVNHLPEFVETQQVILILRDLAEKRDDKALRGTACMCLKGMIDGQQGVDQTVTLDMVVHGKLMGKIVVKFRWMPR
eukprot:PhM_4_TR18100/c2_g1_i1/m.57096